MNSKLKPCPFCGGDAEVLENITNPKMHTFHVECTKCLAQMGRDSVIFGSSKGKLFFWSRGAAVEAWNKRQEEPQKKEKRVKINDVVQFTEKHKWSGCLGIITEDRGEGHPRRYMIGVPVPMQGTAYIFDDGSGIERIGEAVMVVEDE